MEPQAQRGQALPEYLLALSATFFAILAGIRFFQSSLDHYWSSLSFWIRFPNP